MPWDFPIPQSFGRATHVCRQPGMCRGSLPLQQYLGRGAAHSVSAAAPWGGGKLTHRYQRSVARKQ
ncbi:hypothetical protein E2C01_098757 [Portunus trituberculatus]|uniref:Uncharacterized protein n=1 Tax=Portunus trituberculatus TaxID=210409 RepID=A0A5B7K919_PORTR|nr:hypothetical protein [Portunus trituberculatus]